LVVYAIMSEMHGHTNIRLYRYLKKQAGKYNIYFIVQHVGVSKPFGGTYCLRISHENIWFPCNFRNGLQGFAVVIYIWISTVKKISLVM